MTTKRCELIRTLFLMSLGFALVMPLEARADICWTWAYDTEAGTFVTDGTLTGWGNAPAAEYTVLDISVTQSTEASVVGSSLSGGALNEGSQPITTFVWDGTEDTQWARDNGTYTNGASFYVTDTSWRYAFFPGSYSFESISSSPPVILAQSTSLSLVPAECAGNDPDLTLTVTDSADPVSLGEAIDYTLTIDNVGEGDASDVETYTVASGAAHTVISASASQGSCVITSSDIDCELGMLAVSEQATVTITVEPEALGTITTDSAVNLDEGDPTPADNLDSESTDVVNASPDCSEAEASTSLLVAGLGFAEIDVVGITDTDSDPITITIDSITQDEPTCGLLDPCPDADGVGTATAEVRKQAALLGLLGNGRVYHIGFTAEDGNGGSCEGDVTVGVRPLISSPTPVDDAPPGYDSTL